MMIITGITPTEACTAGDVFRQRLSMVLIGALVPFKMQQAQQHRRSTFHSNLQNLNTAVELPILNI
jgi:preprotein translocase subunit YajC